MLENAKLENGNLKMEKRRGDGLKVRHYKIGEKRDSSPPQADAFEGAKAEEEVGLLRSE